MTPDELVEIVRSHGCTTNDARDAAHEACHALSWGVKKPWTRDNIHAKKPKNHRVFGPMPGVREEILARAVEQLVCSALGFDCGTVEKWAMVCWMEMIKNEGVSLPTGGWLADSIRSEMTGKRAAELTKRILELKPKRKRAIAREEGRAL